MHIVVVVASVRDDDLVGVVVVVDIMMLLFLFLLLPPPVLQYSRQSVKTEKMSSPNVVRTRRCRDAVDIIWWFKEELVGI